MERNSIYKALLSFFIISVIGLQAFTSFRVYTYLPLVFPPASHLNLEKLRSPRLWPFLTYPMYRSAYYQGDEIIEYRAYAVFQDSTEVRVTPEDININFWKFRSDFVPSIQKRDSNKIRKYLYIIKGKYECIPTKIGVEKKTWKLQKKGLREDTVEAVKNIRVGEYNTLD